jgi:multiple sugar transport system ATP-binding protein
VNKFVAGFIGSPPMNMLDGELQGENDKICFRDTSGQVDLIVPAYMHAMLATYIGRKITLGIRPEDLNHSPDQQVQPGKSLCARVEVVEPMGSEINVYLDVNGQSVTASVKTDVEPEVNLPYVLDVNMENVLFFDADTEKTIV